MHETEAAAQLRALDQAINAGQRCLNLNPDYAGLRQKGDEDETAAFRALRVDDAPCACWLAQALDRLQHEIDVLRQRGR